MDFAAARSNGRPAEQEYLRGFWNLINRHRALAFGVPLGVIAATIVFVLVATPIYQADGSLLIDEKNSTIPVLDALKSLSSGSKLDTEMGVLRSRTLAEGVVDSLGLNLQVRSPRRVLRSALFRQVQVARTAPAGEYLVRCAGASCSATDEASGVSLASAPLGATLRLPGVELMTAPGAARHGPIRLRVDRFEDAVKDLRRTMVVDRLEREADLIALRYQSPDPELAAAVPNEAMRLFLSNRQATNSSQALNTAAFLRTQIDTLNGQLRAAENALKLFQERNHLLSPEAQAKADVTQLATMRAARDAVEAERGALAGLVDELQHEPEPANGPSPMRWLIAFPTMLKDPAASELFRALDEQENQRAELLTRRTPEDPDVQAATARVHALEQQLTSISMTYLASLTKQVNAADSVLGRYSASLQSIPATEIQYARLQRQAKVLSKLYTLLQTRLKESEIMAAMTDPTARVIDAAIVPYRPFRPNIPLTLMLSVVVGIVLGVGLAFAREHLDTSVRTREDLQVASGDIPVLATIPIIRVATAAAPAWHVWRRGAHAPVGHQERLVAVHDPSSPVSEAYRSLRTNITFSQPERAPRVLVFTSPEPGDGKSTSTVNLAAILAHQGVRCMLLDADLRRGVLHEVVEARREPGLSNVLVGAGKLDSAVQRVTVNGDAGFDFMAAGRIPPNPAELLGSTRMAELIERLRKEYDMVLIDAPPLNLVTDAAVIGTKSDGVIVVARAGVTDRGALQYAMEQLRAVRAPVVGSVLNGIDARRGRYYGVYGSGAYTAHANV